MLRKSNLLLTRFFLLVMVASLVSTSVAMPVWADGDDGELTPKKAYLLEKSASPDASPIATPDDSSDSAMDSLPDSEADPSSGSSPSEQELVPVHKNLSTFEKNFDLSVDQKIYTITEIDKVVSEIIDPEMSDLEKYYTLACWANNRVVYDNDFWKGGYDFDYYRHQWDAYGAMKEDEKSVCVGIAIFYANLCHAADLACRFVRLDPEYLDHTINYIPDINGHAFYSDVTENVFLMTDKSGSSFVEKADTAFANITKDANDYCFDVFDDGYYEAPPIYVGKKGNNLSYDAWFKEYALHENTKKTFRTKYVENGSGLRSTEEGYRHASYSDPQYYPSQHFVDKPSYWFLDDFYKDPAAIETKVLNKEFDDQLLNVSVKPNYDVSNESELIAAVTEDLSVQYFPSSEGDKVVPEAATLENGTDYDLILEPYDESTHTAVFTIKGTGAYSGSKQFTVSTNSAVVTKEPVHKKELAYDGTPHELVEPGEAECGGVVSAMQYALGTETEPTGDFGTSIPAETNAGEYYVWYKASGDANHADSEPQRVEMAVTIDPMDVYIHCSGSVVKVGKTLNLAPELDIENLPVTFTYKLEGKGIVTVSDKGIVKGLKAGTTWLTVHAEMKEPNPNYLVRDDLVVIDVVKNSNPMSLKAKTVKIKYKALKKKARTVKRAKAFTVSNPQGTLSYKLVSAKKGKKSFKKKFSINAKTGKVTVKKRLKKGTYKVTVQVKANGNATYKASAWKKVTFKVKVK